MGVPSVPQNLAGTETANSATATWTTPVSNGGSPITGYTVTASPTAPGGPVTVAAGVLTATVPGLTYLVSYTLSVVANNVNGASPAATVVVIVGAAEDTALHAPARTLDFRYERYDANGNDLGPLTTVISASVAYDSLANIKRTAQFTLVDDGTLNVLSERIKAYVRLLLPNGTWSEFPMGLFLLSTPPRSQADHTLKITIDAYDLLQLLTDDRVSSRYTVASGTAYTTAVTSILTGAGLTAQQVTASSLVTPAAIDWPPGTPKLTIINQLLAAINYLSLWFDASGTAVVQPYVAPSGRTATYTYADDVLSVVLPTATQQRDLFAVPNQVIATVSEPDQSVLNSTATNTSSGSPTSTVSRGRTIVQVLTGVLAPDQTTLDAITARALTDAASVYEEITWATAIMPFHGNLDALQVTYSPLGLNAVYIEHAWTFDLKAGGTMTHQARKAISV